MITKQSTRIHNERPQKPQQVRAPKQLPEITSSGTKKNTILYVLLIIFLIIGFVLGMLYNYM